jgi:hypothetical protein
VSDSDFPSGPWTGYYTYVRIPVKCRTDVRFTFANSRITGEGNDNIGPFVITGSYDVVAKECCWTKTYVAAHDVFYKGFREGRGIWGTWEIGATAKGGFELWPLGLDAGSEEAAVEEEELLAELPIAGRRL